MEPKYSAFRFGDWTPFAHPLTFGDWIPRDCSQRETCLPLMAPCTKVESTHERIHDTSRPLYLLDT